MNRRGFLGLLGAASAATVVKPDITRVGTVLHQDDFGEQETGAIYASDFEDFTVVPHEFNTMPLAEWQKIRERSYKSGWKK